MTTQKIEFEYVARNEQASSRAWHQGQSAIDGYNRELAETNAKTRQAAEAMSAFGQKGKDAFAGMDERQRRLAQGLEKLREINQKAERDAWRQQQADRTSRAARMQAVFDADAARSAVNWSSSATAARRNADRLRAEDFGSGADVFGMLRAPDDDGERRLTTGSRFRGRASRGRLPVGAIGSGMAGMGNMLGLGAIAGGAYLWQESNRQMIEKADNAAEAYDTLGRSLNIQAGLMGTAAREARERILKIAMDASADKNFAFATATQLVSSGFSAEQATGGALREMLTGMNAMPAPGGAPVDPVALAEAAVSYLTSQDMAKTDANLRSVLAGVQQLYKTTNFQLADFAELSGQADTMRGKLTMGEQFGAFSVLRDVGKSSEEATTALRNIAIRAQTVGADATAKAHLADLGLNPEDIDMVGESFQDVLNRLAKATDGVDPAKVTIALEKVFGERTLAGLLRLVEDRQKVAERASAIGDQSVYEENAKEMSSGVAAAKRRQTMESENFAAEHSQKDDLLEQELAQQALGRGEGAFRVAARRKQYQLYRGMGLGRDTAAAAAFGDYGLGVGGADRLSEAKRTLGEKGVKLTPGIGRVNPDGSISPETRSFDSEMIEDEERRAKHRITREEALKLQPNFDQLPRPGAKTSAPAAEVADVGAVEMKNPSLERGVSQQVALLTEIADGITQLSERLGRGGDGRAPRRATPPWDARRPPPVGPVMSLSASEVG